MERPAADADAEPENAEGLRHRRLRQHSGYLAAAFSSLDYSISDMVKSGMALLMKRILGERSAPETVLFEPRIVCRGSCGRPFEDE